jgi:hypothetical protein
MRRLRAEEHNVLPIHISHHASARRGRLGEDQAHRHDMNGHTMPVQIGWPKRDHAAL